MTVERRTCNQVLVAHNNFNPTPRYALHLVDTVKVTGEKAILLTDGVKSVKDTLFFEAGDEDDVKSKAPKKPPVQSKTNGSASPAKNKTVAGKVLRTKTRSAAQESEIQTTAAKIKEHQIELHTQLQAEGLAKHSEDGGGTGGKEGKGWKRFQSYKGEAGLPKEVESMKVCESHRILMTTLSDFTCRFS